ncbi:Urea ABC transporter, permease protein UrtB [Polaromonas sp. CG9_12]|nr:Urea ABC transporter, permease protein UrtB [Polaromonas sp. CG9_12]
MPAQPTGFFMPLRHLFLIATLFIAATAHALSEDEVKGITFGDVEARVTALNKAAADADEKTVAFIQALSDDAVKTRGDKVFVIKDDKALDPLSGAEVPLPPDAEDVINPNFLRSEMDNALAALKLLSKDETTRAAAIKTLTGETDEARLPLETDADVKVALKAALARVEASLAWGDKLGAMFSGISLGSILLLVALGLAITYGLMGVINMAHGELMMIGAYATYVVQGLFQKYLPGAFDWYLLAAVPVAFMASALMGAALERSVIRFLYGRPLETLLATWGISLMLQQLVRSIFGAQNVGVENPVWMSGGVQVLGNLSLPYNRLVIIAFAVAVLLGVAWLISKTRLGLFVRGVTQNRPIASCMGVNTARIDTYAFALGSGIAGLAGCALSQVGNVGPDLGQGYIVDAFMVVVLGGVGQLAGTVYAAMGLGILNKFLEGWTGAVLAKIAVLVIIIVFIQKRPQGIFAMKGRSAEA